MLESHQHKNTDFFHLHFLIGQEKELVTSYALSMKNPFLAILILRKHYCYKIFVGFFYSYILTCVEIIKHLTDLSKGAWWIWNLINTSSGWCILPC